MRVRNLLGEIYLLRETSPKCIGLYVSSWFPHSSIATLLQELPSNFYHELRFSLVFRCGKHAWKVETLSTSSQILRRNRTKRERWQCVAAAQVEHGSSDGLAFSGDLNGGLFWGEAIKGNDGGDRGGNKLVFIIWRNPLNYPQLSQLLGAFICVLVVS